MLDALRAGARLNEASRDGSTPLGAAATGGSVEACQLLLDAGAAVDVPGGDGATPLFQACLWGRLDVVRLLVARGADSGIRDQGGWSSRDVAVHRKAAEILAVLDQAPGGPH
jgi:ankyrin repeat protein